MKSVHKWNIFQRFTNRDRKNESKICQEFVVLFSYYSFHKKFIIVFDYGNYKNIQEYFELRQISCIIKILQSYYENTIFITTLFSCFFLLWRLFNVCSISCVIRSGTILRQYANNFRPSILVIYKLNFVSF